MAHIYYYHLVALGVNYTVLDFLVGIHPQFIHIWIRHPDKSINDSQ